LESRYMHGILRVNLLISVVACIFIRRFCYHHCLFPTLNHVYFALAAEILGSTRAVHDIELCYMDPVSSVLLRLFTFYCLCVTRAKLAWDFRAGVHTGPAAYTLRVESG
jgi:hypothetical protein